MRKAAGRWLLALVVLPGIARAEPALVLPPRSERPLSAQERTEVTAALEAALQALGVEHESSSASEPCADAACIAEAIRIGAAAHAVELTVWGSVGEISGVSVSLVQPSGERYSEGAPVERGQNASAAIERAAHGAYERMRRGPGPWLQVQGSPAGAAISIDGQAAGTLPRQVKVTGGLHRVVVSHPGYASFDETVTVPRNLDALKALSVRLQPEATSEGHDQARSAQTSVLNYAIAGAAAALGVVLAIRPLRSAIDDGECGRVEDGRCTGIVAFEAAQAAQLAGAGILLASGVTFAIWAPLRTSPEEAITNIAVSGRF